MSQYQTGIAATAIALQTIIETFCTDNGFTLNAGAGSWLSKGQSHVKLLQSMGNLTSVANTTPNTVSCVFSSSHGLQVGDTFTLSGCNITAYNGTFTVDTVPGSTSFTYIVAGASGSASTLGTMTGDTSQYLLINGANSSDGATELCPSTMCIYIPRASWPVTYYLFYADDPDQVTCIVQYDTTKFQTIMFGEIVKVHGSAYVGGNWFFATRHFPVTSGFPGLHSITDTYINVYYNDVGSPVPFPTSGTSTILKGSTAQMHCKIDTRIWNWADQVLPAVTMTIDCIKALFRSPNTWNSQAHLVPINLQFAMESSLKGYIGYVEHIRMIRMDNYEAGDIITLGSDQWMVFPCLQKSTLQRNGKDTITSSPTYAHSGTLGFALRYLP